MFYCDECAEKNGWPKTLAKSKGKCECCGKQAECNERSSSKLPLPRQQIIQYQELLHFRATQKVLFARSNTKQLEIYLHGNMEIRVKEEDENWDKSRNVWQGTDLRHAVEEYNQLT
jgi:hypothetical protein